MDAVITNIGTITNVVSGINVGTRVDVAVCGDRGLKHRLGKRLVSHRSFAAAAPALAPAMPMPMPASAMRYQQTECSSSRWQNSAAFELPPAAWAALVIARAL
jgi:hypothetical protein